MARTTLKRAKDIKAVVAQWCEQQKNNTYNYKQVSHAIGVESGPKQRAVAMALAELSFDGDIIEVAPGKYKSPNRKTVTTGVFVRRSTGKNSVITDGDGECINVAERNSMHALNGDKVRISLAARRRGAELEAEVIEILERNDQVFIGTLEIDRRVGAFLTVDSKYLATDIIIPRNKLKGGERGDKAIVRITDWPENAKSPRGEVVDILGKTGENQAEMHAILAEFGLPYRYPKNVEDAANKIDAGITPEVVAEREDLRDVTTFTIDPRDAKDFDDAISFKRLSNGNFEIGVHIADVTYYVHADTIIDKEAFKRATSVYLVDRTIPMLPEHLCNGICSLRPNEDKLTFSCLFEMDNSGKVHKSRICRTVICSDRRFTYEEAQEIIETGSGEYADELHILNELAKILRKQRYDNGAVNFDRSEVRFEIDEDGTPLSIYFKEAKDANKLIEEFMLLANRAVAEFIGKVSGKKPKAFVYRVHEPPEPGKLNDLSIIAKSYGYRVKTSGSAKEINRSINKLLVDLKGKGEENFLSLLAIKSMSKAVYSTQNIGHYGLAFDFYTHFTSPIRRYPDMMVHRLLERYMAGKRSVNIEKLEEKCTHSTDMEILATNAERASIKYKQVEFMSERLGEIYEGTISGVTEWGLYVELTENKCEGLVPMRDLADDYYDLDEQNYCLIGRRHGHRYRLGDTVKVQVAKANLERKQLDFALIEKDGQPLDIKQDRERGHSVKKKGHGKEKKRSRNKR
ncbi:MAG: ribonuclease R [Muribaculaceae bacterium]|nr:ribonuclease R [Muribaculaceae bacterium]